MPEELKNCPECKKRPGNPKYVGLCHTCFGGKIREIRNGDLMRAYKELSEEERNQVPK